MESVEANLVSVVPPFFPSILTYRAGLPKTVRKILKMKKP